MEKMEGQRKRESFRDGGKQKQRQCKNKKNDKSMDMQPRPAAAKQPPLDPTSQEPGGLDGDRKCLTGSVSLNPEESDDTALTGATTRGNTVMRLWQAAGGEREQRGSMEDGEEGEERMEAGPAGLG